MEHVGVVQSVNPKPTSKGTVYEVTVGNSVFTTWKDDLGKVAQGLVGQNVTVQYESRTKGDYTNHYLNDIVAAGGQLPQTAVRENATEQVQGPVVVQATGMPPDREARIVRQSSMKTAFEFVGAVYGGRDPVSEADFNAMVDIAETLAARIFKLAWGGPQS